MRREPDYEPDALRENIKLLDRNIARLREAIKKLQEQNARIQQRLVKNNADIQIFATEIAKLEQQKEDIRRLIARIEKKKRR